MACAGQSLLAGMNYGKTLHFECQNTAPPFGEYEDDEHFPVCVPQPRQSCFGLSLRNDQVNSTVDALVGKAS